MGKRSRWRCSGRPVRSRSSPAVAQYDEEFWHAWVRLRRYTRHESSQRLCMAVFGNGSSDDSELMSVMARTGAARDRATSWMANLHAGSSRASFSRYVWTSEIGCTPCVRGHNCPQDGGNLFLRTNICNIRAAGAAGRISSKAWLQETRSVAKGGWTRTRSLKGGVRK
jgi:hypothetical protein